MPSTLKSFNNPKDENPAPKSSREHRKPYWWIWWIVSLILSICWLSKKMDSVSSNSIKLFGILYCSLILANAFKKSLSLKWTRETLTEITNGFSPRAIISCKKIHTSSNIYRSSLIILSFLSKSGIKSDGYIVPRSGWNQRTKASAPPILLLEIIIFGCKNIWKSLFFIEFSNKSFNSCSFFMVSKISLS